MGGMQVRAFWYSFVMFWFGVLMWLTVKCNQECKSISSSECDIPTGAWILGAAFALITFVYVASGRYDRDNKK